MAPNVGPRLRFARYRRLLRRRATGPTLAELGTALLLAGEGQRLSPAHRAELHARLGFTAADVATQERAR
ncbi:MAG TPA: hypothetical protein VLH75_09340 [Longimicrobiales bacterium]|nr:hypothetical protein [Longimicrobiales bacterium]